MYARLKPAHSYAVHRQHEVLPPLYVECAFYAMILYGTMGTAIGLSLPVPASSVLALLAACCLYALRGRLTAIYGAIAMPVACGMSYLLLQLTVHDEPLLGEYVRPFVSWILMLVISQSLATRPGYLHRMALTTFGIGVLTLPYLNFLNYQTYGSPERAQLDGSVSFSNSNDLAAWFGFCAVYFITTAVESRLAVRFASATAAVACLAVVGLTVSRTALLAVTLASVVALRRLVRAGLLAVVVFILVCTVVYESGVFQQAIVSYTARGRVETGRLTVWPLAVQRFLDSPLVGVGASAAATDVSGRLITPHNAFLFLAVTSGIIPVGFFLAYWWRTARAVLFFSAPSGTAYAAPLVVYAFICIQGGNVVFIAPWVIAATTAALATEQRRRAVARQLPILFRVSRQPYQGRAVTTSSVRLGIRGRR